MSKVEEGNLFFRRFGRTALALSMVTTGFIFADQTITVDTNTSEHLEDGETNSSIGAGVESTGTGANVTINTEVDVSGAIIAGEYKANGTPDTGTVAYSYFSGHDSVGAAIGFDINDSITDLVNLGSIGADAHTLDFYTDSIGGSHYVDQNNTQLTATAVNVANEVTSINNSGSINASAVLNNDTNNSSATAAGILVSAAIAEGIVNTGDITATASTHNLVSDGNGGLTIKLVAEIGGRNGNGGQTISTADLGKKAKYAAELLQDTDTKVGDDSTMVVANNNLSHTAQTNPRMLSDTRRYDDRLLDTNNSDNYASQSLDTDNRADYNDQFHIVDADGAHQKDRMQERNFIRTDNGGDNNSHMHRGVYTEANLSSPGDLDNVITAAGIKVDAAVTGGIINHSYISSVLTTAALTGSADGNDVGLTVTPNTGVLAGADTSGIDPNAVVPDVNTTLPDLVSGGGATGNKGGATYAIPPVGENGTLPDDNNYSDTALADAEADIKDRIKDKEDLIAGLAPLPAEPTDAAVLARKNRIAELQGQIKDIQDAVDTAAIKDDIAKAYGVAPDAPAATESAPVADAPALPRDGV